jgi:DNA-binding HxlR family transcriptional regulator
MKINKSEIRAMISDIVQNVLVEEGMGDVSKKIKRRKAQKKKKLRQKLKMTPNGPDLDDVFTDMQEGDEIEILFERTDDGADNE